MARLCWEYDTEPYAKQRDGEVASLAAAAGVEVHTPVSHTLYVRWWLWLWWGVCVGRQSLHHCFRGWDGMASQSWVGHTAVWHGGAQAWPAAVQC